MNPKNIYANEQNIPSWVVPVGVTLFTFAFAFGLSAFGTAIAHSPIGQPINTFIEAMPESIGKAAYESDGLYLMD